MITPPEEEFIRVLKFGTIKKIRDLINNNPMMDLQYPTTNLSTPLTTALDRSDPVILAMLIDKIPNNLNATLIQPCGKTALMHAAYYAKNPEILHVLLKRGADPNKVDINGWNSLFYAVIGKRLQNLIVLLDYISIESRDYQGRTPLMISVYLSNLEIFDFLINQGSDLNAVDNYGLSVLHLSILRRKRDFVIELLKRNSDASRPLPLTKASVQRVIEELMFDIMPVQTVLSKFY